MKKLIVFGKRIRLRQPLTIFLAGVVFAISNAYGSTLLQAKNLANSKLDNDNDVQTKLFSFAQGGANPLDTNTTFNSFNNKIAAVSASPSFRNIKWNTVAPSPIARTEAQGAAVNGKLYLFGGYINTTYTPTRRADVYNPINNTWTRIKDLPKGLTHSGTAVDGTHIYLAGGYPAKSTGGQSFATTDVWKYNVATNTWSSMPPLPEARGSGALELLNGQLHFFGGSDIKRADRRDHWVLSLNGGTRWLRSASLPQVRNHIGDAVVDGTLYAIGGQVTQEHTGAQVTVYRWNPATDTWTTVASLPRARSHIAGATFVMDDRIIVIGGIAASGRHVSDVTAYNPRSNSWQALTPLPIERSSGVAGHIGNQIFYTTGNGFQRATYKGVPVLISP